MLSSYELELVELYTQQFIREGYEPQRARRSALREVRESVHG